MDEEPGVPGRRLRAARGDAGSPSASRSPIGLELGRAVGTNGDALSFPMWCQHAREYVVVVSHDLPEPGTDLAGAMLPGRRALVVTTPTVDRLHGREFRRWLDGTGMHAVVEVVAVDEQRKTMETALHVARCAQRHDLGRRDVVIAFGGGVCSDVVSVAASLTRRGIAHVTVPTTLVGQVDAGIGLKGGVNFGDKKNYLGCFAPPERALIVPRYLQTLPARELRCGMAEIVKMALIRDRALFDVVVSEGSALLASAFASPPHLVRYVVGRSIQLMLEELEPNSFEDRTLQRLVDFGHTFSSTLEERSGYELRHGEAVAVDMALTCELGTRLGILDRDECDAVLDVLVALGLPVSSPLCTDDAVADAMAVTVAHRGGRLNLVVPRTIGSASFVADVGDVPTPLVNSAIESLRARAASVRA